MNFLVLNAGSSSLKFRLIDLPAERRLAQGLVEKWGTPSASLTLTLPDQPPRHFNVPAESPADAATHAIDACRPLGIHAIAHRVVHGGPRFIAPARVTPDVIADIRAVSHLAPLHNDLALAAIEASLAALPGVPNFAAFDTAFHHTMPELAWRYAIPRELADPHALRRYGFHGLSHHYVSTELLRLLDRPPAGTRLITCHLGNGSSVCALRDGRSVDTSMGLTPMQGLVMGTRSGDVDPGLVLHLIHDLKLSAPQVDEMLNRHSGLLALSQKSADVRDLEHAAQAGDPLAHFALESFAYRVRHYLGAYAALLNGIDAVAFTGGIGEHAAPTRARILTNLTALNLSLDPTLNAAAPADHPSRISPPYATPVYVIPTDEELQIARQILPML